MRVPYVSVVLGAVLLLSHTSAWTPQSASLSLRSKTPSSTRRFSSSTAEIDEADVPTAQIDPVIESPRGGGVIESSLRQYSAPLTVVAATVATFLLNNQRGMGPIPASSLVGLLSGVVLPASLSIPALCGSFAGMAKTAVVPGLGPAILLGVLCAVMSKLFDKQQWLVGSGGRLGFIAQCACTLQFLVAFGSFAPSMSASLYSRSMMVAGVKAFVRQAVPVALNTAAGAIAMRIWKDLFARVKAVPRLGSPVAAVGGVGLLANAFLPPAAVGPAFCGTFVAMSAPSKVGDLGALVLASFLAGAWQVAMSGVLLGGWGGKLGTAALLGVVSYCGLARAGRKV